MLWARGGPGDEFHGASGRTPVGERLDLRRSRQRFQEADHQLPLAHLRDVGHSRHGIRSTAPDLHDGVGSFEYGFTFRNDQGARLFVDRVRKACLPTRVGGDLDGAACPDQGGNPGRDDGYAPLPRTGFGRDADGHGWLRSVSRMLE